MEQNENQDLRSTVDTTEAASSGHTAEETAAPVGEAAPAAPDTDTAAEHTPENETPAASAPAEDPVSAAYRNVGVGRKESPFANSPYESPYTAGNAMAGEPTDAAGSQVPPQSAPVQEKASSQKRASGLGKKVAAAVAALAVVAGSCGITAGLVNSRWEKQTAQMQSDFEEQLGQMRTEFAAQIASVQSSGQSSSTGLSAPASTGSMTPAQVYAQNVNSVVSISNYAWVTSNGWGSVSSSEQLAGTGSGFIISEDGYVMTNYHVIEGASRVVVTTYTGDEFEATVVGYDELNDVALLKVDATGLDAVAIGSSDELLVGDQVVAIGNPLGDELASTMTVGYVSGKDRSISTDGSIINMLQTDAAINSGNSGGPLFNMNGEVIGITSAKYSGSSSSGASIEGIGFAIPIDDVMGMIDDFMNYGYLRNQAYLGVTVMDMSAYASTAQMYNLPVGSYVQEVVEGGSADRAGILPQDIIIAIGEYEVDGNTTLSTVLRRFSAGDTTTITVYRSGAEVTLDITFDERPQNVSAESTEPTEEGEMPDTGSYEEWYDYFSRYFGNQGSSENGQP